MRLSQAERLLLETARGIPERQELAWRKRQELFPLQSFPSPADQLLTLVAAEYKEKDDLDYCRLQGILQHCWVNNQYKLALARSLGEELVWLGNLAFLLQAYIHKGQRPIYALEAWVAPEHLTKISTRLSSKNFFPTERTREWISYKNSEHNLPVKLFTRPLPLRSLALSASSKIIDGFCVLSPELLLLRQCLLRHRSAWWLADLLTLLVQVDVSSLLSLAQATRSHLALYTTLSQIKQIGLNIRLPDIPKSNFYPGERLEYYLGPKAFVSALLSANYWHQLPITFLNYIKNSRPT